MGFYLLSLSQFLSSILFLFHFQTTISSSNDSSPSHSCAHDQSLSLLQFKASFSINSSASGYCQHPKTESWKEGTDCCLWDGVTCELETGVVTELNLACSLLYGTLHSNSTLFSLRHLRMLDLSDNDFISSHISPQFGQFSNLTHLSLNSSAFAGQVPSEISLLSKLVSLDLSANYYLSLEPLSFEKLAQNLTQLRELDLSTVDMSLVAPDSLMNLSSSLSSLILYYCELQGKLPSSIGKFKHLQYFNLRDNNLTGSIPYEFAQLNELVSIDLGINDYLSEEPHLSVEPLSFDKIVQNLTKLRELHLGYVNMDLVIPNSLANLSSSLSALDLWHCGLQGKFPGNIFLLPNLQALDLTYNDRLTGSFPSSNASNGLWLLGLSRTRISVDLGNDFFTNLKLLEFLVLRDSNILRSNLTLIGHLTQLIRLDLACNKLGGQIPSSLKALALASNSKLTGEIPSSICKLKFLRLLDLSNNSFSGFVPQCLGNFSNSLSYLNLGMNNLQGTIFSTFSKGNNLVYLNLNGNELEGKIPSSIINCANLKILDLGNNKIEDTFPYFLETLPELHVLVLRSNKLQGFVNGPTTNDPFPKLRIFDISSNNLSGPLPTEYLSSLEALMAYDQKTVNMESNYSSSTYSIRVTWKGFETEFEKIQSALGILDFSNNNFTGEIPKLIGKLNGLRQLNLSHNSLRGQIPLSLGMLFNLESLDLSSNLITGGIPQQLAFITFLAVLNLSHNQLEGAIPSGKQFNTFNASSFEGNLGLCGFPMPNCSSSEAPALQPSNFHDGDDSTFFADGFGWKAVAIGYGCGFVFGVTVGYVVFRTRKPAWFLRLVEDKWNLKARRTKKNARRNGVRRN